jgi:hypothetical protein
MKIAQLLSGVSISLTNQEQEFIQDHAGNIHIDSLAEHDQWLAQNLVRKGIYTLSKDNQHLIKNVNETSS